MSLQAFIVVFGTHSELHILPTEPEIKEAFVEYMGLPNEFISLNMWPVEIERISEEGKCRKCGESCPESRLLCDSCNDEIAEAVQKQQ